MTCDLAAYDCQVKDPSPIGERGSLSQQAMGCFCPRSQLVSADASTETKVQLTHDGVAVVTTPLLFHHCVMVDKDPRT